MPATVMPAPSASVSSSSRLGALDAMRGLTIALMIMVNNALWDLPRFEWLNHVAWNGLSAADLVFPFFMFIMGVSVSFSLRRYDYRPSGTAVGKILRRTVVIFLIGLALDMLLKGINGVIQGLDFSQVRILGVLPRLALSYGFAALLALFVPLRGVKWLIGAFLAVYAGILLCFDGYMPSAQNILARVDIAVLGPEHMYHDYLPERTVFDPEGILGTIPSVAHVLIGYLCGRMLMRVRDNSLRVRNLLIVGSVLAMTGFLLNTGLPINKKVWSPTFVMVTCGMGAQLLGLLIYLIDIRGYRAMIPLTNVFGVNPLALYVFSSIAGCLLWRWGVAQWIEGDVLVPLFGAVSAWPSLLFSLFVVGITWAVGYPLWRRKIYIKI